MKLSTFLDLNGWPDSDMAFAEASSVTQNYRFKWGEVAVGTKDANGWYTLVLCAPVMAKEATYAAGSAPKSRWYRHGTTTCIITTQGDARNSRIESYVENSSLGEVLIRTTLDFLVAGKGAQKLIDELRWPREIAVIMGGYVYARPN